MDEQRAAIKVNALAGKSGTETYKLLQAAFGDTAMSRSRAFAYYKEFKEGRETIRDRRGQFSLKSARTADKIDAVRRLVTSDQRLTIDDMALESGLSHGTVHTILHDDLGLTKRAARWVPRLLTSEHKEKKMEMARSFIRQHFWQGRAFLESLVTMDEMWVSFYTPELKSQSMQWLPVGAAAPKKAKTTTSTKKLLFIAFFDFEGLIYQHFVPPKQTINSVYYIEVLSKFLKHLNEKRPDKVKNGWLFHQDNARPHVSRATMEFMAKRKIKLFEHAPFSPDLAPCDFYLFPELKKCLAGHRYESDQSLITAVQGFLKDMSKEGFLFVMEQWQKRLEKCIKVDGNYVEK